MQPSAQEPSAGIATRPAWRGYLEACWGLSMKGKTAWPCLQLVSLAFDMEATAGRQRSTRAMQRCECAVPMEYGSLKSHTHTVDLT